MLIVLLEFVSLQMVYYGVISAPDNVKSIDAKAAAFALFDPSKGEICLSTALFATTALFFA